MATRRVDRTVSQIETTALIDRLARRKSFSQGVVEDAPDFISTGSAASLSITNEGLLRVETVASSPPVAFFSSDEHSLWSGVPAWGKGAFS